jgi:hypothetical protein
MAAYTVPLLYAIDSKINPGRKPNTLPLNWIKMTSTLTERQMFTIVWSSVALLALVSLVMKNRNLRQ